MRALILIAAIAVHSAAIAASSDAKSPRDVAFAVRQYRERHEAAIVRELAELIEIPNLARDATNIRRNASKLEAMLRARGIDAKILQNADHPPAVFGDLRVAGATRTVMFYAHYDGQPVDPEAWASPPWKPVLRTAPLPEGREIPFPESGRLAGEWRLYARSASDDKAPIVALLRAVDALRQAGISPGVNVKFFFEGEEEAGSPHLRTMLEKHKNLLAADLWLFCDGPVHQTRRPQVVFGVRGTMGLELTVYGPRRALHSGHYGNWAPNPAAMLAELIAGMRDSQGRITIAGFGSDVRAVSAAERAALGTIPDVDSALRKDLGLGRSEGSGRKLAEAILQPALNVRGLAAGAVDDRAANAIPTEAHASIDFRLVPNQTPRRVRERVEAHLRKKGWHVVHEPPDDRTRLSHPKIVLLRWEEGYPATRTDIRQPLSLALLRIVEGVTGEPPIAVPTLGGSLPMHVFGEVLRAPVIVLPMVNHDNNQHAANENLRLQNLWEGMELYAAVMATLRW